MDHQGANAIDFDPFEQIDRTQIYIPFSLCSIMLFIRLNYGSHECWPNSKSH